MNNGSVEGFMGGRTVAEMDNEEKAELCRIALQGLVSRLANAMWTPQNAAKMTILSKVIETGTAAEREQLHKVEIEKMFHSLVILTCIDIVYPISQLQMPEVMSEIEFVEVEEEDDQLPLPLEEN